MTKTEFLIANDFDHDTHEIEVIYQIQREGPSGQTFTNLRKLGFVNGAAWDAGYPEEVEYLRFPKWAHEILDYLGEDFEDKLKEQLREENAE